MRYSADTAGGLMQSEYAAVLEGATVEEAVEIVRTLAETVSDIHNVFVVDHRFHLLGVLSLAQLILARAGQTVDAVMDRQVISVTVNTDQEEVAQLFRKYDLLSLPVTDPRGALLGRITIDDVVDVLKKRPARTSRSFRASVRESRSSTHRCARFGGDCRGWG